MTDIVGSGKACFQHVHVFHPDETFDERDPWESVPARFQLDGETWGISNSLKKLIKRLDTDSADAGEMFGIIDISHDKRIGYIAELIVCLGFMKVLSIESVRLAI